MVTRFTTETSWALLAWGFEGGGRDDKTGKAAVIVDLDTSASEIRQLKNDGHAVICYFSVGTTEPARSDYKRLKSRFDEVAIAPMADWPDEEWLDIGSDELRDIMETRFEFAAEQGCDGVEPDNVDCYDNPECFDGLGVSRNAARNLQISFNRWQTETAKANGLMIGLKNSLDLVDDLVDEYDFAVNESCQQFNECDVLEAFHKQNKAVFHIEYETADCGIAATYGIMTKFCDGNGHICSSSIENCFLPNGTIVGEPQGTSTETNVAAAVGGSVGAILLLILAWITKHTKAEDFEEHLPEPVAQAASSAHEFVQSVAHTISSKRDESSVTQV
mmetsp:Transcript_22901/g.40567  ORF Transcript_22901/g.40567 Transcript_22901/m.40567 type:complete len:332 (-) Transcript_22901:206-1201(-)